MTFGAKRFSFRAGLIFPLTCGFALTLGACKSTGSKGKGGTPQLGNEVGTGKTAIDSATPVVSKPAGTPDKTPGIGTGTAPQGGTGNGASQNGGDHTGQNQSGPATTLAWPASGIYLLKNVGSQKCLEFIQTQTHPIGRQAACHGTSPQYFHIWREGDANNFRIQNIFAETFVQIRARSTVVGGPIELAAAKDDVIQQWAFDKKSTGKYAIRSLFSAKILDVKDHSVNEEAEVIQTDFGSAGSQLWQLILQGSSAAIP